MAGGTRILSDALKKCFKADTIILFQEKAVENSGGVNNLQKPLSYLGGLVGQIQLKALYYYEENKHRLDTIELIALGAYMIIKEHYFTDGNKRTAFKVIINCLRKHGYRYVGRPKDLARKIEQLATEESKQDAFLDLAFFLKKNVVKNE